MTLSRRTRSRLNLTFPLLTTLILMVLLVIYTSRMFYRITVSNIYEVGEDKISGVSASLGNYMDTAKSVMWVTADTIDFMKSKGTSNKVILDYLKLETQKHKSQFDENYTGLYGYISGEYLDGLGWEPPEGFDPTKRDWYVISSNSGGNLAIVPPYIDAQTGSMVISVCKCLSDRKDVVSLDVYTTHIQEIIESTNLNGKGYGFIVSKDGTVIAHPDRKLNGTDYKKIDGGSELLEALNSDSGERFETDIDGRKSTVFSGTIMDQWHLVIVVDNDELYEDVYSQLKVNIIINTIVLVLITLFYYISYRNEQKSSRENESLKIREQQKAYEAEILRLEKTAADSANKAKGDFLAQMSHEIRTPINAVLGMNEMILRESDDDKILDYSENIQTAGKTLLSLINSILDFSKIEDGKMEILPVRYDTAVLIHNLVNSVSERARAKGLEFRVNADPNLPSVLIGDDVRVTQVIGNLLTNAVKYTEKGSVTLNISCSVMTGDEAVLSVSVSDTGIGIRKEDLDKLFESFTRLETERNRNIEGTGLGMAIVTRLLALMDSKLDVESTYGEGSVFSFELKQKIADASPVGNALEHKLGRSVKQKKQYEQYTGAKVLVTDDNDMNLKVADNLLRVFGIKPDLATSGEQTLELMGKQHYDLLLLDHMMPQMDGIQTLQKLREQSLVPEGTAIVALTANAVLNAKDQYLEAGFDDYLSKPISLDELAKLLSEHLNKGGSAAQDASQSADTDSTTDDAQLRELSEKGFSVGTALGYCMNDADFCKELMRDYADSYEKRTAELDGALESGDMKLYRTYVHSLKSASKTVGADDVAELSLELEQASERGDAELVSARNGELKELFGRRTEQIRTALGAE